MLRAADSSSYAFRSHRLGPDRIVRYSAVAEVVVVAGLLCEIQSTMLRNLGVERITFRGCQMSHCTGAGRAFPHHQPASAQQLNINTI